MNYYCNNLLLLYIQLVRIMAPDLIDGQEDTLRRQLLSKEEVRRAVGEAIKIQAGNLDIRTTGNSTANNATISELNNPLSSAVETAEPQKAAKSKKSQSHSSGVQVNPPPLVLSAWALDTAISAVMRVPTPRLGQENSKYS